MSTSTIKSYYLPTDLVRRLAVEASERRMSASALLSRYIEVGLQRSDWHPEQELVDETVALLETVRRLRARIRNAANGHGSSSGS